MVRLVSGMMILISRLSACTETMLVETSELEMRIGNGLACCACLEIIEHDMDTLNYSRSLENEYQNYSHNYFCCPKCDNIAHISCFLKPFQRNSTKSPKNPRGISKIALRCPNTECSLLFKVNDINRLFAQLLYTHLCKYMTLGAFELYCKEFFPCPKLQLQNNYLNILIRSSTVPEFGSARLREVMKNYQRHCFYECVPLRKLKMATGNLDRAFPIHLEQSKLSAHCAQLSELPFLLHESQNLWDLLCKDSSPSGVFSAYEEYVYKASSPYTKQHLASLFMYFVMRSTNPFKYMEDIYIAVNNTADLRINVPLASDLLWCPKNDPEASGELPENHLATVSLTDDIENIVLRDLLSNMLVEFEKNNSYTIESKISNYLQNENKGVFVPTFINYFENNGMLDKAREIARLQVKSFSGKNGLPSMSIKNAIYVLCAAPQLGVKISIWEIDTIIFWIHSIASTLTDEEIHCITFFFEHVIAGFSHEHQDSIQDMFVKNYTADMGKIYSRCMPQRYYDNKGIRMADFALKRNKYLKEKKTEYSESVAMKEHHKLLELRNAYESEQSQTNI
ncbi:hypothetical protein ENBRE01_0719 [Enteropsectra breve]|nr:hypothetical protein ENBRE01_0719 [Enteropsectra breve]